MASLSIISLRPARGAGAIAAVLISLGMAGCQPKSEQVLEAAVCGNLEAVGSALEQVAALKPSSTVGEASAASKALDSALNNLNKSEVKLEKVRINEFRAQLKSFNTEVNRVSRNKKLTLEEAAADLKSKAAPVIAARRRISEQVKCAAAGNTP
jgi:hypothetical protein